ncbi:hypothetical protein D047_1117A, partial [Vibrio parahaemolyticus VPTS-2010_2]
MAFTLFRLSQLD